MSKQTLVSRTAKRQPPTAAQRRAEFYGLPPEAMVDRETVADVSFRSVQALEVMAIRGGGPLYRRVGRRALYRKQDVLDWLQRLEPIANTAQLAEVKNEFHAPRRALRQTLSQEVAA